MKEIIENLVKEALKSLGVEAGAVLVEHPSDLSHGDYSTNAGIKFGHKEELLKYLNEHKPDEIEKIDIAGPGFINFHLSKEFFKKSIGEIVEKGSEFGKNENMKGEKVMVEHTDPNPFKSFHIGHLMPNVVGSTLARIFEWSGAEVKQACYQGDVGMHTAKAVWGMVQGSDEPYVFGNKKFEEDENVRKEIQEINKKIYDRSDENINKLYDEGRKKSLEYFDSLYKRLGSHFDYFFFESEAAPKGQKIVEENMGKVFEVGENGAVVFHAENYDKSLHTRVFINSEGIPTYEAKELGLAPMKFEKYPYTKSVVVTGNEVNDYFKVLLQALKLINPKLAEVTTHIGHGMLRLTTGKMSSRTGDVIEAEELINEVKEKTKNDEDVAVGAIKYMILRQSIGNDIIFDIDKSVSTEGDSGVYLQYAYARTTSLLEKAKLQNPLGESSGKGSDLRNTHEVEKILYRFPEIVEYSGREYAPNHITTYLTELAGAFNNFYAHEQVISDDPESAYRLAIVEAFRIVMKNGLTILGIPAPERM
ncbi:MAG: arginine--tRNA ligase [Minisyncoccota bacterium]